jgi:predicted nucleotidyltransferase
MKTELTTWFAQHPQVCFAVLFGSWARETGTPRSDVDLAVYTYERLPLLERGAWIADLERLVQRTVDLVWLNPLPGQDPALAYEILSRGQLLFCRDRETYVAYKTTVMLRYLDTAYLRRQIADAFERRHLGRPVGRG